jgi:ATP-dependent exoDNAse (exonuclease V) beta subunit
LPGQTRHEEARLLYVATTRAKERLHLLGDVRCDDDGPRTPGKGSLLEKLWPVVQSQFTAQREAVIALAAEAPPRGIDQRLRRLPSGWSTPAAPEGPAWSAPTESLQLQDEIEFSWAGETALGKKHYYRVQGPTFLIEHDNSQNDGNHVHSVWRDFNGDFGRDLLREHLAAVTH